MPTFPASPKPPAPAKTPHHVQGSSCPVVQLKGTKPEASRQIPRSPAPPREAPIVEDFAKLYTRCSRKRTCHDSHRSTCASFEPRSPVSLCCPVSPVSPAHPRDPSVSPFRAPFLSSRNVPPPSPPLHAAPLFAAKPQFTSKTLQRNHKKSLKEEKVQKKKLKKVSTQWFVLEAVSSLSTAGRSFRWCVSALATSCLPRHLLLLSLV